jgi:hypothetical protein
MVSTRGEPEEHRRGIAPFREFSRPATGFSLRVVGSTYLLFLVAGRTDRSQVVLMVFDGLVDQPPPSIFSIPIHSKVRESDPSRVS